MTKIKSIYNNIKIAQFNSYDINGGAAKASYRLFLGLKNNNQNITYYVKQKEIKDNNIVVLNIDNKYEKEQHYFQLSYIHFNRTPISNTYFSINLNDAILPNLNKYDVVNIHWIEDFLSLKNIYEILKSNIPIIWTLHDMKPFTGGCHYSNNCEKFVTNCLDCIQLNDDLIKLPNKILSLKKELFKNANLTIVTPSKWLAKEAKKSTLFKNKPIKVIPNAIDSNIFLPTNKLIAKKYFNIPTDKIVLSFGVQDHSEKRKGFSEILQVITSIKEQLIANNVILLFFGKSTDAKLPIDYINLGHIANEKILSLVYSATDIFILPSLEDNLPNTILESLSCETPVISFDTGGAKDIISEKNGIIVEKGNITSLSNAILTLVTNDEKRIKKGKEGRKLVLKNYQLKNQAEKYLNLYNSLINKKQNKYTNEVNFKPFFHSIENHSKEFLQENKNLIFSKNYNKLYNQILNLKNKNEKYILYGNGTIGKLIKLIEPKMILATVDKNSNLISKNITSIDIYSPENIINIQYDKIIISVLGREEEIIKFLVEKFNINEEKIITFEV